MYSEDRCGDMGHSSSLGHCYVVSLHTFRQGSRRLIWGRFAVPPLINALNVRAVFVFGATSLPVVGYAWCALPETKGRVEWYHSSVEPTTILTPFSDGPLQRSTSCTRGASRLGNGPSSSPRPRCSCGRQSRREPYRSEMDKEMCAAKPAMRQDGSRMMHNAYRE